ncbi:MAG TPA: glycine oxidase ThiO [Phycisphaerae bacterium]|nr:glycine oxidase ThiO [Phycisphaerae bacterium]HOJ72973.1 glycine oxidase ThiO [Phycisphaerae bacterium]HOM50157.1 glycine oxidase ThiO [Phycisphaerae bacterium]HON65283.1 glycine oxidase ThiO [Phycisphaerae bacterium]HOQ84324.1 glycine oxidase ThiO [Phycisphaerae bacterium]
MSTVHQSSDVIVIGGGVIGLAIADRLARDGARVTLLERGQCGREASWAGAGIIQSGSWHRRDPLVQMQRDSVRDYANFTADLRERTGIDPEYECCGTMELLLEDQQYRMARSEFKAAAAYEKEYGRRVIELWTPEQARSFESAITTDLLGVKYDSTAGQVRSPRLLRALQQACIQSKVNIVEQCEVKGLIQEKDRVTGVRTVRGSQSAGHVVLAAGVWSARLDQYVAAVMPTIPVRGQMVLLNLPTPLFARVLERGRTYLVPRRDGHVLLGATQEPEAGFDKDLTAGGVAALMSMALRLVPGLKDATVATMWAGLRPGTPDSRPYIGPVPGMSGLIAATGHFRCGLTLAPTTARIVSDLILRGESPYDLARCLPGRPVENRLTAAPA